MELFDYPAAFWYTAVIALLLVGIGKAGFAGGVGIVATPLLALTIPVADAAALLLPLLMIMDVFSLWHYRHAFDRRSIQLMLPGAVLGIAVGGFFFGYFSDNERILRISIGVLALLFLAFQLGRMLILGALEEKRPPNAAGIMLGGLSGFTSTLAHAGGPPAIIYLLPQKLPRNIFVGTTVFFFAAVNWIKVVPYSYLGLWRTGNILVILILSPLCFLGVRIGVFLNGRVSEAWFSRVVYLLLFLTGIQLVLGRNLLDLVL